VSVTVRIPTILRQLTGGASEVQADGATLSDVLKAVDAAHPGVAGRVLDDDGKIRRFVNVYVGDEDVRFASGLETPTPDGVLISIIPAVAGGSDQGSRVVLSAARLLEHRAELDQPRGARDTDERAEGNQYSSHPGTSAQ
jgi:molybdopterin converting factor small subunit